VKPQNLFRKYLSIYRFHSAYGVREGISRVLSIFRELDLYDLRRGVNTRTIKVVALEKSTYMPYWPAFTSVVREMIKFSYNYYISAIRYSDLNRKTVFVDFGAGLAKTPLIAAETDKFDVAGGIEIDPELVDQGHFNLDKMQKRLSKTSTFLTCGNVEDERDIKRLIQQIEDLQIVPGESTLFIFNKNSYGPEVLRNSLVLIQKYFDSIVYMYQNPIHSYVLSELGFLEFGKDSAPSTEHKNYKYQLFFKHKYLD
jgi:hypothetical protein